MSHSVCERTVEIVVENMGWRFVTVFCLCGFSAVSSHVTLSGDWLQNFGWEITCSWGFPPNDTLQSVRLFRNNQQFIVYRPETSHQNLQISEGSPEINLNVNCNYDDTSRTGKCKARVEFLTPHDTDYYKCEVSGERPYFKIEEREFEAYVGPTNTRVTSRELGSKETLNCTSSGIPAPKLTWTVDGHKIPEDFQSKAWNSTSKLWDSWSAHSPQDGGEVLCTPVVETESGRIARGKDTARSSAISYGSSEAVSLITLTVITLLS